MRRGTVTRANRCLSGPRPRHRMRAASGVRHTWLPGRADPRPSGAASPRRCGLGGGSGPSAGVPGDGGGRRQPRTGSGRRRGHANRRWSRRRTESPQWPLSRQRINRRLAFPSPSPAVSRSSPGQGRRACVDPGRRLRFRVPLYRPDATLAEIARPSRARTVRRQLQQNAVSRFADWLPGRAGCPGRDDDPRGPPDHPRPAVAGTKRHSRVHGRRPFRPAREEHARAVQNAAAPRWPRRWRDISRMHIARSNEPGPAACICWCDCPTASTIGEVTRRALAAWPGPDGSVQPFNCPSPRACTVVGLHQRPRGRCRGAGGTPARGDRRLSVLGREALARWDRPRATGQRPRVSPRRR